MSEQKCSNIGQKRTPNDWSDILSIESWDRPSGVWADYNSRYREWQGMVVLHRQGFVACEDIPDKPDINDYTDLNKTITIDHITTIQGYSI